MKSVKPLSVLLIACALLALSCKNNDDTQNVVPTGLLSGYLCSVRTLDNDSPATRYTEQASAFFTLHPGETLRIPVDSVKINGIPTVLDNTTTTYTAAGGSGQALQTDATCNWQVWSSGNVSTFSYNFATPYPRYTTYTLPDTIDAGKGFTISLPAGEDSATITLIGSRQIVKSYKGATGSYAPSDLAMLGTGNVTMTVSGYKMTTQAFGGKNFRFTKQIVRSKVVLLQ